MKAAMAKKYEKVAVRNYEIKHEILSPMMLYTADMDASMDDVSGGFKDLRYGFKAGDPEPTWGRQVYSDDVRLGEQIKEAAEAKEKREIGQAEGQWNLSKARADIQAMYGVDLPYADAMRMGLGVWPEEDFILGTLLGYSRMIQCQRYLQRKKLQLETQPSRVPSSTVKSKTKFFPFLDRAQ